MLGAVRKPHLPGLGEHRITQIFYLTSYGVRLLKYAVFYRHIEETSKQRPRWGLRYRSPSIFPHPANFNENPKKLKPMKITAFI